MGEIRIVTDTERFADFVCYNLYKMTLSEFKLHEFKSYQTFYADYKMRYLTEQIIEDEVV